MKIAFLARPLKAWKHAGLLVGTVSGVLCILLLTFPQRNSLMAKGPMNIGHEDLDCQECHLPARGTLAQQFSSNVYHWLGLREAALSFGSEDVASGACLDCHERPDDRHPISRFLEPHFAEARRQLKVQDCTTCHAEHQGKRVTLATIGYCVHCHQDTALAEDPILPTHAELVRDEFWNSCLQCHDFHGNHKRDTPALLADGISEARIWAYFDGAPSPYSSEKRHEPFKKKPEASQ